MILSLSTSPPLVCWSHSERLKFPRNDELLAFFWLFWHTSRKYVVDTPLSNRDCGCESVSAIIKWSRRCFCICVCGGLDARGGRFQDGKENPRTMAETTSMCEKQSDFGVPIIFRVIFSSVMTECYWDKWKAQECLVTVDSLNSVLSLLFLKAPVRSLYRGTYLIISCSP